MRKEIMIRGGRKWYVVGAWGELGVMYGTTALVVQVDPQKAGYGDAGKEQKTRVNLDRPSNNFLAGFER